jgi:hypothetical protein
MGGESAAGARSLQTPGTAQFYCTGRRHPFDGGQETPFRPDQVARRKRPAAPALAAARSITPA